VSISSLDNFELHDLLDQDDTSAPTLSNTQVGVFESKQVTEEVRLLSSEDQALRREYQVQRLIQGMGQGITADSTQLDTLALQWLRAGPIEEDTYLRLLDRFKGCRPH